MENEILMNFACVNTIPITTTAPINPLLCVRFSVSFGKPLSSACSRPGSLYCAVPRRRVRLQRAEKVSRDCCYRVNGSKECGFVGFRWLVEAADLSHVLVCGSANLVVGHRRFEVEEDLDVSTHKRYLRIDAQVEKSLYNVLRER